MRFVVRPAKKQDFVLVGNRRVHVDITVSRFVSRVGPIEVSTIPIKGWKRREFRHDDAGSVVRLRSPKLWMCRDWWYAGGVNPPPDTLWYKEYRKPKKKRK